MPFQYPVADLSILLQNSPVTEVLVIAYVVKLNLVKSLAEEFESMLVRFGY